MGNQFGKTIGLSIFGESHGKGIGIVIDNLPPGMELDLDRIKAEMDRRRPGGNKYGTKRNEADEPEILSGFVNGRTTGTPLAAIIRNTDTRSGDYSEMETLFRPSHGDYPGYVKYHGCNDVRGGGHFSARVTAPLVFAGAVAKQYLEERGVKVYCHVLEAAGVSDTSFLDVDLSSAELKGDVIPVLDQSIEQPILDAVEKAREDLDSIGGVLEVGVTGMDPGIGNPFFESVESEIARMAFSIPGVKGISFGKGFGIARMKGSEANDQYDCIDGRIVTTTNNNGGITGGITNGMPIVFQLAFKPTSSISREQQTVDKDGKVTTLSIRGRHDPSLFLRGVVVSEAATALVLMDLLRGYEGLK